MSKNTGEVIYDAEHGHVCTCARRVEPKGGDQGTTRYYVYDRTVEVDRTVEPTESGSWWYVCTRCGAGTWSGC